MATLLYVASTETFVGKSAVCLGLLSHMRHDGFRVSYMKPVSVSAMHTSKETIDEDVALIKETMGLDISVEHMSPVLITPRVVDDVLGGKPLSYAEKLQEAYVVVSREKDVVLLEGTNRWVEGALVDLAADQVANLLHAPVMLVCRYHTIHAVDNILTVHRYLGNRIVGVLINQIEKPQLEFVKNNVAPFLEKRGIPVLGMLPHEKFLASVTVGELLEHVGGHFIGSPEWREKIVESLMIGAMGAEAGLSFFRRRANKAVVTGGDRVDLQLVALETSTSALVLTGNIRPSTRVLHRAEEREVPIIIVPDDTLTTVERAEQLFGRVRFRQHAKLQHFMEMLEENFDYHRFYKTLGITKHQKS